MKKNNSKKALIFFLLAAVSIWLGLATNSAQSQESADSSPESTVSKFDEAKTQIENSDFLTPEQKQAEIEKFNELIGRHKEFSNENRPSLGDNAQSAFRSEEDLRAYEKYYRFGSVEIDLSLKNKEKTINAGEKTDFSAKIINNNPYPIFSGQLYIQVLKENDPDYAMDNGDHLIDNFLAAGGIAIDKGGAVKEVNFSWTPPAGLTSGDYKLASFFTIAKKYNLSGLTFAENVFASTLPVTVKSGGQGQILIDRNNIKFNGEFIALRAASPFVEKGKTAKFEIPIVNNSAQNQNIKVTYDLYYWDGLLKENKIETKSETISLASKESKILAYEKSGTGFPVNFLLMKAETAGGQKSMLKLRWGEQQAEPRVRINFAGINLFPLVKGQDFDIFANYHVSSNFMGEIEGKVEISLYDKDGELVERLVKEDSKISANILNASKTVKADSDYDWLKLVARVYDKNGTVVDDGTIIYDSSLLRPDSESVVLSQQFKEKKRNASIVIAAIIFAIILIVVLLIYAKKKNRLGIFTLILLIIGVSIYLSFSLFSGNSLVKNTLADFSSASSPWPTDNTSNPRMTVGAWQILRYQTYTGMTSLDVEYNISAKNITSGQVISGDQITLNVGDKIRFKVKKKGEHFTNSGYMDTPSVYWVDWDPSGDLYSKETKEKFASVGDGPIREVYKSKNYAAYGYDNIVMQVYAMVVAGNPALTVESGSLLGNCVQEDIKNSKGLYTGTSYLTCEAIKAGTVPVSYTIGKSNFQEHVTDYWPSKNLTKTFCCYDNLKVNDTCPGGKICCGYSESCCAACKQQYGDQWCNQNSFCCKGCEYFNSHCSKCVTADENQYYYCRYLYHLFGQQDRCITYSMNDNVKHPKVSYAKRFAWPCPGEAGENINWSVQPYAKKMYGCREMKHICPPKMCFLMFCWQPPCYWGCSEYKKNNYLTIPAYTKTWKLRVTESGAKCPHLNVTANPKKIENGKKSTLTAKCSDGADLPADVTWSDSPANKVTLEDLGQDSKMASARATGKNPHNSILITAAAGSATGNVNLSVTAGHSCSLSLSPSSFTFGSLPYTLTASRSNGGGDAISISLDDTDKFQILNNNCAGYTGDGSCNFKVKAKPSAQNGDKVKVKVAASDCPSPVSTGTLLIPCAISAPKSIEVPPESTKSYSVNVTGAGCSLASCSLKSGDSSKFRVVKSGNSCKVTAKAGATYKDSAVAKACASDSTCRDTNIYVKRVGWIEVEP